MATFYTIHCYDLTSNEDVMDSRDTYSTLEMACDAIEHNIQEHITFWNKDMKKPEEADMVFEKPDREKFRALFERFIVHNRKMLGYYRTKTNMYSICRKVE